MGTGIMVDTKDTVIIVSNKVYYCTMVLGNIVIENKIEDASRYGIMGIWKIIC